MFDVCERLVLPQASAVRTILYGAISCSVNLASNTPTQSVITINHVITVAEQVNQKTFLPIRRPY